MDLENHILKCFENVENDIHKLSTDCFKIHGMSGKMTRKFFNNLGTLENIRYLEIGSYKGSTMCSILENNKLEKCTCIDNWSQFEGPKDKFISNINKFKGDNNVNKSCNRKYFYGSKCFGINIECSTC